MAPYDCKALRKDEVLLLQADKQLAEIRVVEWRKNSPEWATRLLRRRVVTTYEEWEDAEKTPTPPLTSGDVRV